MSKEFNTITEIFPNWSTANDDLLRVVLNIRKWRIDLIVEDNKIVAKIELRLPYIGNIALKYREKFFKVINDLYDIYVPDIGDILLPYEGLTKIIDKVRYKITKEVMKRIKQKDDELVQKGVLCIVDQLVLNLGLEVSPEIAEKAIKKHLQSLEEKNFE